VGVAMTKALWYSLTGGLAAWTAHLLGSYLLADLGCVADTDALWLGRHVLTVGAVVAVTATLVAARPWVGRGATPALAPTAGRGAAPVPAPYAGQAVIPAGASSSVGELPAGSPASGPSGLAHDAAVHEPERRFLAYVALVVNAIFLFSVVLTGAASLFLPPCA
jgi:hypothetical protein